MDKLPVELVEEILLHLPSSSCPSARLTSRTFNAVLSRRAFHVLASFARDPDAARRTLAVTARDPARRTRAIWSPHCLVPKGLPITESFLLALWTSLRGESWTPPPPSSDEHERRLTVSALQRGLTEANSSSSSSSGDGDNGSSINLSADALRDIMFRYALYLSYVCRDEKAAPQGWVFDFLLRRDVEVTTSAFCGMTADKVKRAPVVAYLGRALVD